MANLKSLSPKKFLSMLSDRQARFNSASTKLPEISDQASVIAKALHPKRQYLKIDEVKDIAPDCKSFTLVPNPEKGTKELLRAESL